MFDPILLDSLPRFFAPLLLAAVGGALCDRAGVFNIALEGKMLFGAFFAVAGSYFFGSWAMGLLSAALAGAVAGLIFSLFAVYRKGDDIVVSIGLNILALGLTLFLLRAVFNTRGQFDDPGIVAVPDIGLRFLEGVPVLGPLLTGQSLVVWFSIAAVVILHYLLMRHRWGLRLRAAGENPAAIRTVGLSPEKIRAQAVVLAGVLCALAGAQLSISSVTLFTEGMSAGRGWIAVVIVLMCRARLPLILPAAVVFGLVDAFGFRIQSLGLPQQLTDSLPYLASIVILALVSLRERKTVASG